LLSHASHAADMVLYILGPVKSVFGRIGTRVNPIKVEDCAAMSIDSSAKLFMSLLSKARDFLPGLISFTGVNARRENLITALSAPWHSSGYALYSPAGRPTSLTMNPSISTPSQNEIPPLPRLDGAPQTLEHRREALGVGRLSRRRFSCAGGRPWVGTKSGEIRLNWAS
jgi:hypothetical protein